MAVSNERISESGQKSTSKSENIDVLSTSASQKLNQGTLKNMLDVRLSTTKAEIIRYLTTVKNI